MPTMPDWAEGARIVFDTTYPLAFVRKGRRGLWTPYFAYSKRLVRVEGQDGRMNLDNARREVLEAVGASIGAMAKALHPLAPYHHLGLQNRHACGIDYMSYKTVYAVTQVDCPLCLAVVAEDLDGRLAKIDPKAVEIARERVRTTRTINALGKAVTGEGTVDDL